MAQIAAAQADDLVRMTEAKLGTLSLILQRVYARRGDAGLNDYFQEVEGFSELLEFAGLVPLDTPMLFPRRLNATTIQPDETEYKWSTDYEESLYFIPPEVSDDDVDMRSHSSSQEGGPSGQDSPVHRRASTEPADEEDRGEGPSTQTPAVRLPTPPSFDLRRVTSSLQKASRRTAAAPPPGLNPLVDAAARRRREK